MKKKYFKPRNIIHFVKLQTAIETALFDRINNALTSLALAQIRKKYLGIEVGVVSIFLLDSDSAHFSI